MSVTSVSATNAATTSSTTDSSSVYTSQLDANAFLKLFCTQLQYQDPTNPMESYELASQLAQFTSVQKLMDINTNLASLQSTVTSLANAQMVGMIGKQVVASTNALQVTAGTATNGQYQFDLDSGTANVTISISDANGNVVRTKTLSSQAAGQYNVDWDGRDSSNNKVSDGSYTFAVKATDSSGKSLDVTSSVSGTAYSCRLDSSGEYFVLDGPNGLKVPVSSIVEITDVTSS
jgi:flagellar basal-body rod modification protein FlgD